MDDRVKRGASPLHPRGGTAPRPPNLFAAAIAAAVAHRQWADATLWGVAAVRGGDRGPAVRTRTDPQPRKHRDCFSDGHLVCQFLEFSIHNSALNSPSEPTAFRVAPGPWYSECRRSCRRWMPRPSRGIKRVCAPTPLDGNASGDGRYFWVLFVPGCLLATSSRFNTSRWGRRLGGILLTRRLPSFHSAHWH